MKKFDLELRVSHFGSLLTWEILLEDATNKSNRVLQWSEGDGFFFKKLPGFQIGDNALDVFAGCRGIMGGNITCEVFINGQKMPNEVLAKAEERNYAHESYTL
jgi:hypothetical protein